MSLKLKANELFSGDWVGNTLLLSLQVIWSGLFTISGDALLRCYARNACCSNTCVCLQHIFDVFEWERYFLKIIVSLGE